MKSIFTLTLALLSQFVAVAQCMIDPWSLEKRIDNSTLVVEAEVIAKQSTWDAQHHNIYTLNTLRVYRVFKGSINDELIQVLTLGGIVGMEKHEANPSLQLNKGDLGIFLLKNNDLILEQGTAEYKPTASTQSFIQYNLNSYYAFDSDKTYTSIKYELYPEMQTFCEEKIKEINAFDAEKGKNRIKALANPVISSFDIDSLSSGTGTLLKISGSNFGTTRGSGRVGFKDANFGDGRYYYSPLESSYVSWSDSEIEVYVPTRAGTGIVEVISNSGESGESSAELFIKYSHLNVTYSITAGDTQFYEIDHISKNLTGGYTWNMTHDFSGNIEARNSFLRALEAWRCGTQMNWITGKDTSLDQTANDGANVARFSDLDGNTLGVCWSRWSGCFASGTVHWYVNELDIEFDSTYNWYYGTGSPAGNEHDFQSVATHELGHGHQLGHVRDQTKVMHYALGTGDRNADLHEYDIEGGQYVKNKSTQSNDCGPDPMIAVSVGACLITSPIAQFNLNKTELCPEEEVVFTDISEGYVTGYMWHFGEDASDSTATLAGPHQISYASAGEKTISLIVENSFGKDTIEHILMVNPPAPNPSDPFVLSDTSCIGMESYSAMNVANASTYSWTLSGGGNISGSANGETINVQWTESGTHQITLVAINSCGSSPETKDTLYIRYMPVAGFTESIDKLEVIFSNTSDNAISFVWSFGDGESSFDENTSHHYGDKGNYTVKLKSSNECGSDSTEKEIMVHFGASIEDHIISQRIYPNPVIAGQTITIKGKHYQRAVLYSILGNVVHDQRLNNNLVDIPKLPEGIYVIRLLNDRESIDLKLLVRNE